MSSLRRADRQLAVGRNRIGETIFKLEELRRRAIGLPNVDAEAIPPEQQRPSARDRPRRIDRTRTYRVRSTTLAGRRQGPPLLVAGEEDAPVGGDVPERQRAGRLGNEARLLVERDRAQRSLRRARPGGEPDLVTGGRPRQAAHAVPARREP